jgi:hypothetical protein
LKLTDWQAVALWGIAAFLVHAIGNETHLYFRFGWFQNLTHAWSASAMAALLAVAGSSRGLRGRRLVLFVLVGSAVGALTWEAVEYVGLLDPFGVPLHFHDVNDMLVDMASNSVGVSVTLGVLWQTTRLGIRLDSEESSENKLPDG